MLVPEQCPVASRLYFGEKNITGMLAVLEPLHAILERGPQTLKETSFFQVREEEEVHGNRPYSQSYVETQ